MSVLLRAWRLLTPAERRRCVTLQLLALMMGLATVAGIAAVMPFFAVLGDPSLADSNALLRGLHGLVPSLDERGFAVFLGVGFIVLLLLSSAVNLGGSIAMARFAYRVGDRLRIALFARYLARDYLFHARSSGATLGSRVLYQSDRVTGVLQSAFVFVSNAVMSVFIAGSLAIVDVRVAAIGLLMFGACYAIVYSMVRRRLLANGRAQTAAGTERVAVVEQAFAGIKDLLLSQGQGPFVRRFSSAASTISRTASNTQFIGLAPRYLLESLAGVTLIVAALLLSRENGTASWLGQLTFFAVAGYRLLPAIQQCYFGFITVRANQNAFDEVARDLEQKKPAEPPRPDRAAAGLPHQSIELREVSFRYETGSAPVVDRLSLNIAAGTAVAFVGANGSGKTTTADLIVALLTPDAGEIRIDGQLLGAANRHAWQRCVAYVPQQIFILDASVRDNIAFGVEREAVDEERLREAARFAGAQDFIGKLPRGYDEPLGARGARLSGGQRQQIGLARALYREPTFLVLDEATSSLDGEAAQAVVDLLGRLRGRCTVLAITHHEGIASACDVRLEFREGRIVARRDQAALGALGGQQALRGAS
jgi:HlyD family secretion protein